MNYRDIRYKYYKDEMNFKTFRARHDIGKLPYPYHGYYTFLWKRHVTDISFYAFAKRARVRGTEYAIKVKSL